MQGLIHLVEDDADAAALLAELLEMEGAVATTSGSLPDFLALPLAPVPMAVVSDFHIGGGHTGAEVMVAALQRWPQARAVLVSGLDGPAVRAALERQQAGLSARVSVLAKPLDIDELLQALG